MLTFLLSCKHLITSAAWFQATTLCKEQFLANIRLESTIVLPFGPAVGFKWPNAIVFYLCYCTFAPFSLTLSSSKSKAPAPFFLPLQSTRSYFSFKWFTFDLILWETFVTSWSIFFCICVSYKCSCGTTLDEMGKDSFTIARGVILRSGWNQKFCRFRLTRALLNGLSQASVHPEKTLRYCCMTAKVAGCITDMYPA